MFAQAGRSMWEEKGELWFLGSNGVFVELRASINLIVIATARVTVLWEHAFESQF